MAPGAEAPRRVLVVGPPGAGKSWLAQRVAAAYGLRHTQLDSLKLKPIRQVASPKEYQAALEGVLTSDSWLLDGNWDDDALALRVWGDADLVVWLDFRRGLVIRQVAWRSLRRLLRREDYFGWTERLRDWFSPTHPLRWTWSMALAYAERYALMTSRLPRQCVVHLRTREETHRYLADIGN